MLTGTTQDPLIGDVIDLLNSERTVFYRYFPTDRIKQRTGEPIDSTQT